MLLNLDKVIEIGVKNRVGRGSMFYLELRRGILEFFRKIKIVDWCIGIEGSIDCNLIIDKYK